MDRAATTLTSTGTDASGTRMLPQKARTYLQYLLKIQHIGRVLQDRANSNAQGISAEMDKSAAAAVAHWLANSQMTVSYRALSTTGYVNTFAYTVRASRALSEAASTFGNSGMISPKLAGLLEQLNKKSQDGASNGTGDSLVD